MSYRIQAKGSLELPKVDPMDVKALDSYFGEGEDRFKKFYQGLSGRPNARFFAARMTFLNKLSDHVDGPRIILSSKGANVQSLVGKPIHFTDNFEHHWAGRADGRKLKTFGVTLGGRLHDPEEDGSVPLDVFGLLWDDDHPEQVQAVADNISAMGMSWEIKAPHEALRRVKHPGMSQEVLFVGECDFSGTAILKRACAAYPDSYMMFAGSKGEDLDLDLASIPEIDASKVTTIKAATSASSASPHNGGIHKESSNEVPHITLVLPREEGTTSKEKPMGEFCASCKPEFQARLQRGDLITKQELESQEFVAGLKASVDEAKTLVETVKEQLKSVTEERDALKAEKAHLEMVAEAETDALKAWEAEKETYGDDAEIRTAFLAAKKKILLAESVKSVAEGYEELRALDRKVAGTTPAKGNKSRFDAFGDDTRVPVGPSPEDIARSKKYVQEHFHEASLRSFLAGQGINPHARMREQQREG